MASGVTPGDRGTVQSPPVWTDGSDVFVFQSAGPHKTAPREAIPPGQPLENGEHDAVSDHSHDFGERSPLLSPDSDESPAKLESGTPVKPPTSKIGVWAAVLSLVRASIGPGSMALPYAFSQSGIAIGLGMLVVFTVAIFINMRTLVALKRKSVGAETLGDVGEAAMGPFGRGLVEVTLAGMELGICTVYFSYISTNLGATVRHGYDDEAGHRKLMLMLFPVLAAFGLVTRMRVLAAMSSAGNVLMIVALGIMWYYLSLHLHDDGPQRGIVAPDAAEMHKMLLTVATIMYSFEGVGAVLPIENAMAAPDKFGGVLWVSFTSFFLVYALMGILGALAFDFEDPGLDPDDRGSITAVLAHFYNTGIDAKIGKAVNTLLAITVGMTYPIQFFAAIEVIEYHLGFGSHGTTCAGRPRAQWATRAVLRCTVVGFTLMLAYCIPKLSLIIALFGAMFGGMVELVLPPLLLLCHRSVPTTANERALNRVLLVVGGSVVLACTIQAAVKIFQTM